MRMHNVAAKICKLLLVLALIAAFARLPPVLGATAHQRQALEQKLSGVPLTLPSRILRQGYKSSIDARNWPTFLDKLATPGSTVTIAVLGGSVSVGHGNSVHTSYPEELVAWLRKALPDVNFKLANLARRATAASFAALCLLQDMPTQPPPDLVIVEYSANGYGGQCQCFTSPQVSGFEMLLRKVIRANPHAALLSVAAFLWDTRPGVPAPFYYSGEDQQNVVAKWYRVPMMSVRDAFWQLMDQPLNPHGFNRSTALADTVHPSDWGTKHYASLVGWYIRHQASVLAERSGTARATAGTGGSEPVAALPPGLPAALNPDTAQEDVRTFCTAGLQLKAAAAGLAPGWRFVDEGTNKCEGCHKYGWATREPGAQLTLKLDTNLLDSVATAGAAATAGANGNAKAQPEELSMIVSYLLSYQHMGRAKLECLGGCRCNSTILDAHSTRRTSELTNHRMGVTPASNCQLRITTLKETTSGKHKFRLAGVAVHKQDKILSRTYAPVYD